MLGCFEKQIDILYIMAVINNNKITWHTLKKNNDNIVMIKNIYNYFKHKYNKESIKIEPEDNIALSVDNLERSISTTSDCLFVKIYFRDY